MLGANLASSQRRKHFNFHTERLTIPMTTVNSQRLGVFFLASFFLWPIASAAQEPAVQEPATPGINQQKAVPDKTVVYKPVEAGEDLKLDIFLPPEPPKPAEGQVAVKRPAIVLFFGGGWNGGGTRAFANQARHFADRGMIAFCPQYRTRRSHKVEPYVCVSDAKSAMRYVRKYAQQWNVDPERIVAGGGSAGGHLAAATSLVEAFDDSSDDVSIDCRPCALVLFNPVFDNGPTGYGHDRVKGYWKEFSPMHQIDRDAVPTLVMLGTEDALIPVATAQRYQDQMKAVGVRCDLELYPGQPHGFFNSGQAYHQTLKRADDFLVDLGYLEAKK